MGIATNQWCFLPNKIVYIHFIQNSTLGNILQNKTMKTSGILMYK